MKGVGIRKRLVEKVTYTLKYMELKQEMDEASRCAVRAREEECQDCGEEADSHCIDCQFPLCRTCDYEHGCGGRCLHCSEAFKEKRKPDFKGE